MEFAVECGDLQGDGGMISARRLILFADVVRVDRWQFRPGRLISSHFFRRLSRFSTSRVFSGEGGDLRFSRENELLSSLTAPPEMTPLVETKSPAGVTKAKRGNFFLSFCACSRSDTSATSPNKCLTSGWSSLGACTFSVAQPSAPAGNSCATISALAVNSGVISAVWPSLRAVRVAMISLARASLRRTIACKLRPSAASIAGMNSSSTSMSDANAPFSAGRIRAGSSSPRRTA